MSMMSIYLTNLGRYNEGYLVGEWIRLPIEEEELKKVLKRIEINKRYEEWFITDVEVEIRGIGDAIGEYSNLSTLNELGDMLDELCDWEKEKLQAVLEVERCSCATDIIELINNLEDWDLLTQVENEEDLGYYFAEECCCITIHENLKSYFDYESYGRDVHLEGNGTFTSMGYLIDNR